MAVWPFHHLHLDQRRGERVGTEGDGV